MRRGREASFFFLGAAAILGAACGNVYADPVTQPISVTASTFDAGLTSTSNPPLPCDGPTPRENGPCGATDTVCEVGSSPDPHCNATFRCGGDLAWSESRPPACEGLCPAPETIVEGTPCTVNPDGKPDPDAAELQCTTASGTCACTTGPDGAHAHERKWVCVLPSKDCPVQRPLFGKPCVGDHECDYGSCDFKRGSRMICEDEVWQTEGATCD